MLNRQTQGAALRRVLAVLACLALALKAMSPSGFMPGTSLSIPIVLCTGQGPAMTILWQAGHDRPSDAPHQDGDHTCPFAGHGAVPLAPASDVFNIAMAPVPQDIPSARIPAIAPGRGMAAPPPPSHAPPAFRA